MARFLSLLILISWILFEKGFSQDSLQTGKKIIPLPEFSFNSDFGLKIAGEALIYDYGDGSIEPFRNYSRYRISYSTIGAFSILASNDDVNAFNSDNRIFYYAFMGRNLSDYFFGDTDRVDYNEARYDTSEFYNFEMIRFDIGGLMRTAIDPSVKNGLEFKRGVSLVYERPINQSDSKFIKSADIEGNEGAFLTLIEAGLILDKRDSEFRPVRGFLIDVGIRYAPPILSTHHGIYNNLTAHGFAPILQSFIDISFATRISFQNSIGDRPYWMTPTIGGTGIQFHIQRS
jgi:hypothetical protein